MAGLRTQDQITNGADSSDGMTRFHNQVRSGHVIFRAYFLFSYLISKVSGIQDQLRQFDANVSRISDLHSRSLNNTDESLTQQYTTALDELIGETRALSNQIKSEIQNLENEQVPQGQDPRIRKNQASESTPEMFFIHPLR